MTAAEPIPGAAAAPARPDPLSRRLTSAAAWLTLLVIVAGANVTTTKSGDAVPTWPTGFVGETVGAWIELSHRYVAGLLLAATAVAAWRTRSAGLRRLVLPIFALIVVQAVIGGVRVRIGARDENDPILPWFKVTHAVLGQAIYPLAVCAASLASDWWADVRQRPLEDVALALMRASGLLLLVFLLQILLGALGRHDVLPREVHAVFALVPLVLAARLVLVTSEVPKDVELFRGPAALLGFLTALQLVLGVGSYIVASQVEDPTKRDLSQIVTLNLHVGVSAAMTGVAVSVALRAVRLWGAPTDQRVAEARARAGAGS